LTTAVAAIFVFFLVVLIHELGHFTIAKLVDIKVHEFSIGMGPRIFKLGKGETEYSIRAIPIGGYVKMEGEDEESDDERSFSKKPILARLAVIAAGPIMNFILAIIVYTTIALIVGSYTTTISDIDINYPEYKAGLRSGDKIVKINDKNIATWDQYINELNRMKDDTIKVTVLRNQKELDFIIKPAKQRFIGIAPEIKNSVPSTTISNVNNGFPAQKAGIKSGDKIIKINNKTIKTWEDVKKEINNPNKQEVSITVLRDEKEMTFTVNPVEQIVVGFTTEVERSFGYSVKTGIEKTKLYLGLMLEFLQRLVQGKVTGAEIAGPVGIINLVGEAAKLGFRHLLDLAGFISINLGILNLLPIPALDGGRIMFLLIEFLRGKPLDPEKEGFIHFLGFVFLILLMIFVTYKDVLKLNLF
jgi:regulator of sigma E protease